MGSRRDFLKSTGDALTLAGMISLLDPIWSNYRSTEASVPDDVPETVETAVLDDLPINIFTETELDLDGERLEDTVEDTVEQIDQVNADVSCLDVNSDSEVTDFYHFGEPLRKHEELLEECEKIVQYAGDEALQRYEVPGSVNLIIADFEGREKIQSDGISFQAYGGNLDRFCLVRPSLYFSNAFAEYIIPHEAIHQLGPGHTNYGGAEFTSYRPDLMTASYIGETTQVFGEPYVGDQTQEQFDKVVEEVLGYSYRSDVD